VLTRLAAAAKVAAADPRFVGALAAVDTPVQYLDAADLQRFLDADAKKLGDVVRRIGKVE